MVEDSARNLRAAKELGMVTVLVGPDGMEREPQSLANSVDFVVDNILEVGPLVHRIRGTGNLSV